MSQSDAPSNSELAQRTARIEEQVDHVRETVDRIEARLQDQHDEIIGEVQENSDEIEKFNTAYKAAKWLIPTGIALGAATGALAGAGLI